MLEVIDRSACSESHPVPLLFVHGAWHATWCWDEHFLDFFADKGYRALAVSLRGHGNSPTPNALRSCSMADYVDDVASGADSLPRRPAVIGHSMGGGVVQKYLESHEAPAAVLLASLPLQGIRGALLRLTGRHPWLTMKSMWTGDTMAMVNTAVRARQHMFSTNTPERVVADCVGRF
jgi:pimeloyl-ACP methyl ester carboxylesterase